MGKNMTKEEIIKAGIKTSYIIKLNEGEEIQDVYNKLSAQLCKFVANPPGFTSDYISRGMREIITEEDRSTVVATLINIYFDFINKNNKFLDKYDNYVKGILDNSGDLNKLTRTILGNNEMIQRVRKSCS